MSTNNLPTLEIFKKTAWDYKIKHKIQVSKAYEMLAKEYGYKTYSDIKHKLKSEKNLEQIETVEIKLEKLINDLIKQNKDVKACICEINLNGISEKILKENINKIDPKILLRKGGFYISYEIMGSKPFLCKDSKTNMIFQFPKDKTIFVNSKELIIGQKYIVQPDNPRKLKHRDRTCTLLEFENTYMPRKATVKFTDTKRPGIVELTDLKPIN